MAQFVHSDAWSLGYGASLYASADSLGQEQHALILSRRPSASATQTDGAPWMMGGLVFSSKAQRLALANVCGTVSRQLGLLEERNAKFDELRLRAGPVSITLVRQHTDSSVELSFDFGPLGTPQFAAPAYTALGWSLRLPDLDTVMGLLQLMYLTCRDTAGQPLEMSWSLSDGWILPGFPAAMGAEKGLTHVLASSEACLNNCTPVKRAKALHSLMEVFQEAVWQIIKTRQREECVGNERVLLDGEAVAFSWQDASRLDASESASGTEKLLS